MPSLHAPRASMAPLRRIAGVLIIALALAVPALHRAAADPAPSKVDLEARNRIIKQIQSQQMMEEGMTRVRESRARAAWVRWAKKHPKLARRGERVREAHGDENDMAPPPDVPAFLRSPAVTSVGSTEALPTNVRVNNPAGDPAGVGQAEESIASWGNDVLVAFNDGQGFNAGGVLCDGVTTGGDVQGYAYSTDGGATFTDGGTPPHLGGWPARAWTSDPVVSVNEKTGEFYYCGLLAPTCITNGVGVIRGTFSGATFTWDTPRVVVSYTSAAAADKQWIAADSSNGNLYVSWTKFVPGADSIMFSRSINNGVTWSPAQTMSQPSAIPIVQGSRPVVGPSGEVYVVWSQIGPIDADYYMIRKSTNAGVSFGIEQTAAQEFSNFGTGAPGFNRERGIYYPSIAVDRTRGTHRGRVYMTWNETVNWYSDFGFSGNLNETENNNFFNRANTFTPGQRLRGSLANGELDYWKFTATQGTTYTFWCDSIPLPYYTMRIFCGQDTLTATRLAYSGDVNTQAPPGGNSLIVWTAPSTGTYYLRMAYVAGGLFGGAPGGYRIQCGTHMPGTDVGRDQRDVISSFSDDGTSWSAPIRVNDDAPYLDNWLPEVSVGADGCPYIMWFDWRDAPGTSCAGQSHIYVSRSGNGGVTWGASHPITSAISPWTSIGSNIAPNQGDYSNVYSDARYVRPAWADGRLGTADVWTTSIDTYHDIGPCQNDTIADINTSINVSWFVNNRNQVFSNDYSYTLTSARNWPLPSSGGLTVAAALSGQITVALSVPDSAAAGTNQICIKVANAKGTLTQQCCFNVTVSRTVSVGDQPLAFALHPSFPNPSVGSARIEFNLPQSGSVRLAIYGLRGERVRTLVDGMSSAGPNSVLWDGRDDHGHRVGAGAYFYRLEGFGRTATQRLVFMP